MVKESQVKSLLFLQMNWTVQCLVHPVVLIIESCVWCSVHVDRHADMPSVPDWPDGFINISVASWWTIQVLDIRAL